MPLVFKVGRGEMVNVRLAVFDMVGTTVQAGNEVPLAFREALRSTGIDPSEEELTEIRGRSKRDAISELLLIHGTAPARAAELTQVVYERFQASLRAAYQAHARAVPGAEDCFSSLRSLGIQIVLTTGLGREIAQLLVQSLGWDDIGISGLVTGDDVVRGRPAPDLIFSAMSLSDVGDPKAVLAIGDTVSDLEAASAAGVGWSVGVLTGAHSRSQLEAHPHSVILESVGALPGWLVEAGGMQ